MPTVKERIKIWAFERLTEIVILTFWVLCFSFFSYDNANSFRGLLAALLTVLTFEVTSLFAFSSLALWLWVGGSRLTPFLVGGLALAHVLIVTNFPDGGRLDLFFTISIMLIFLNSLTHEFRGR